MAVTKNKITAEENKEKIETAAVPVSDAAAKSAANSKVKRIYAGATLPGLPSGTVFTGDIPKQYAQSEIIKSLCIPVDKYADSIKKKSVTTSPAAILYRKSAAFAEEVRKQK